MTLGSYPAVSLKIARQRALEAKGAAAGGKDLAAEKRAAREARKAAHATADHVADVVDSFVNKHLERKAKPSWAKEAERLLRVEVIPKFGKKRLAEVRDTDIHALLEEIADRLTRYKFWARARYGLPIVQTRREPFVLDYEIGGIRAGFWNILSPEQQARAARAAGRPASSSGPGRTRRRAQESDAAQRQALGSPRIFSRVHELYDLHTEQSARLPGRALRDKIEEVWG